MTITNITPILRLLYDVYTEAEVLEWLRTPQRLLDNQTPEAVIDAGGYDHVLELARQVSQGIVV